MPAPPIRKAEAAAPAERARMDRPSRAGYRLRGEVSLPWRMLMGSFCVGLIVLIWWYVTRGVSEERIVSPSTLGSPAEVFGSFKALWFDRALTRNLVVSVARVAEGFGLALLLGIPLGVLAGCFPRFAAFLAPITVAGRNIPVAALLPLTMVWFGIEETQKVMFLFIACFGFVIFDATQNIMAVDQRYVDTAYTLGANRRQIIFKVLIPLALPDIFNSMRLLFGLGFGYIILAEIVNIQDGLGALIAISERRGPREHVYLCLIVITLMAYVIDRLLFWMGTKLFSYRYRD